MRQDRDPGKVFSQLLAMGDLKVWSVLVTIFGDLAPDPDTFIPGPALNQLCQQLQIKPAALRVALHRLKKDGWIIAKKEGRVSHYSLSEDAARETRAAQVRVYGPYPVPLRELTIIHCEVVPEIAPRGWLQIGKTTFVTPQDAAVGRDELKSVAQSDALPAWVMKRLTPETLNDAYRVLHNVLAVNPDPDAPKHAEQQLALRTLILHHWRRLVFRHDPLVFAAMPSDWVGALCAEQVHAWLAVLPRRDLTALGD